MNTTTRKSQRGFSLIEALVALLVMSFGMLAVAGFQINLSLNSDVAKQRTEATRLTQQKIEQLRTFDRLVTNSADPDNSYIDSMVSSTETISSNATNTVFTRSWVISTAATPDTGRSIQVTVAWTNRSGTAEQVQLFSYISATDPALNGGLFLPLPDGTILRRPKNRNIDIPIPAIAIAGTDKSFIPWSGTSGGYLVFSNLSGDIVQKCTEVPTAGNLITNVCAVFDGYLLSGYITGASNALVTKIVVPFGSQQYVNGTPECSVGNALDQTTGDAIANTKYYVCLIQPTDHDTNAATARVWSGRVDLAGALISSLGGTTTCRFSTDANTTVNDNHPAVYSLVDRSLDNQNFYISTNSTCPAKSVFHLYNTGTGFTVTYNANGGSGTVPTDATVYATGSTVPVLDSPTPTNSGYTLYGWSLSSGGARVGPTFAMPASNVTLYALWTALPTYKVTYHANDGTGTVPVDANGYWSGQTVTVPVSPVPTRSNFAFAGWSLSESGGDKVTSFAMPANAVTLFAQWVPAYTVTYDANGGTGSVPTDANGYAAGSTVSVLGSTAPTNDGFAFGGWSLSRGGASVSSFTMPASNQTLYAKWVSSYTLTYSAGANGSITGTASQTVSSGGNGSAVTAVPATGYQFANWSDGSTSNPRTDSNVTGNISVTANFTIKTYTVAFNSSGGSAVSNQSVTHNSTAATPTAPTRAGYTFVGWYSDAGLTSAYNFATLITTNTTLYAKWLQIKLDTPVPSWSGTNPKSLGWAAINNATGYLSSSCVLNRSNVTSCEPGNPISSTTNPISPSLTIPNNRKNTLCYRITATGSPYLPSDRSGISCISRDSNGIYSYTP